MAAITTEKVPCDVCSELHAPGAGMASHRRAKHPDAPPPAGTVIEVLPRGPRRRDGASSVRPPREPANLAARGLEFWRKVTSVFELEVDELRLLEDLCREMDLVERMDAIVRTSDVMVEGSKGQLVRNPVITEIRLHRETIARLLRHLRLDDADVPVGEGTGRAGTTDESEGRRSKALHAAAVRWRGAGAS